MRDHDDAKPTADRETLARHLDLLAEAGHEDRDELLTDLLCHVYRSKDAQNG
jgi:hypothetical protein